jgi:hypothetical protein
VMSEARSALFGLGKVKIKGGALGWKRRSWREAHEAEEAHV